jgi:ribosomal protein S18 acetylase RimI-like enzyme
MDITKAATSEDFQAFRVLLDEMAAWDAAETRALGLDPTALLEICYGDDVNSLQNIFTRPRAAIYLARDGGAVAGCAGYTDMGEHAAEVEKVFVRPQFRGRGIGRALLTRMMEGIVSEGYRYARLETASFMTEAIASYERLGFQHCTPFRPLMPGLGQETVFMQRAM